MFNLKKSILTIALAGTILANSNINAGIIDSFRSLFKSKTEILPHDEAFTHIAPTPGDSIEESLYILEQQVLTESPKTARKIQYRAIAFATIGFTMSKLLGLSWTKSAILGVTAGLIGYTCKNAQIKATLRRFYKKAKAKINNFLKREDVAIAMQDIGLDMAKQRPTATTAKSDLISERALQHDIDSIKTRTGK